MSQNIEGKKKRTARQEPRPATDDRVRVRVTARHPIAEDGTVYHPRTTLLVTRERLAAIAPFVQIVAEAA